MSQGKKAEHPARPAHPQDPPKGVTCVALKPRRGLTIILAIAFAAWVGLLATWYVKTVVPMRSTPATQPTETRP